MLNGRMGHLPRKREPQGKTGDLKCISLAVAGREVDP